jgi:hypothetical protein
MTSYINQTIARQQVAELIAQAEQGRVRRQFRAARRAERVAGRRRTTRRTVANYSLYSPNQIGIA